MEHKQTTEKGEGREGKALPKRIKMKTKFKNRTALDNLREARKLVETHWISGYLALDADGDSVPVNSPKAVEFCSLGAVRRAGGSGEAEALKLLRRAAFNFLKERDSDLTGKPKNVHITDVNDDFGKNEALEIFDAAIEAAKK